MSTAPDLGDWVGRQVTLTDDAGAGTFRRFAALLDAPEGPRDPQWVPPLGHWLLFLPDAPQSTLGPDGHPRRGGFLPPIELPNRLWAGSAVTLHRPIPVGSTLQKRTTIAAIDAKNGRSGPLVFVTLLHEVLVDGVLAIEDRQEVAYRSTLPASEPASAALSADPRTPDRVRTLVPDAVQLFRYSAITFNAHRIHYDLPYTREIEGHRDLVVQGPYIAALLLDHLLRSEPGLIVRTFRCRARRPAYAGSALHLNLRKTGAEQWELWATGEQGGLHMEAEVQAGPGP
ncbi:MAG: acyl-CoA dehydrogenase [Panacagrimonas sp.]|nr:MaoC family dehydratase N-terminal domain-containing protein [Panacagrimonas sp.]MCC2654973.1 acyl-CoA dehydrogenase [Panacagrimonas sp.]